MEKGKRKKKYNKPQMVVKKLETYFFACLQNVNVGCTSYLQNKNIGAGCPTA